MLDQRFKSREGRAEQLRKMRQVAKERESNSQLGGGEAEEARFVFENDEHPP